MPLRLFINFFLAFLLHGAGLLFFSQVMAQSEETSIQLQMDKKEYCAGDTLIFTHRISNFEAVRGQNYLLVCQEMSNGASSIALSKLKFLSPFGQFDVDLPTDIHHSSLYLFSLLDSADRRVWSSKAYVHGLPALSLRPFPDLCLNAPPLRLDHGRPKGGYYKGPGVKNNVFYPQDLIPALFTLTYVYPTEGGCKASISGDIEIISVPEAKKFPMRDSSLCVYADSILLPSGKPKGGYFAGGGVRDSFFIPSLAGAGSHRVSYVVEQWGCRDSLHAQVDVIPTPDIRFEGVEPICVGDDTLELRASPSGGSFSGPGVENGRFLTAGFGRGKYSVLYTVEEARCPDSARMDISLIAIEEVPDIQSNGDSLWIEGVEGNIQWWLDDKPIAGALGPVIRPQQDGSYRVKGKGKGDCEAFSAPHEWRLTRAVVERRLLDRWSVFPNPAAEYAVINWKDNFEKNSEIRIYDMSGRLMRRQVLPDESNVFVLKVADWESGIYVAKINVGDIKTQRKIKVKR